MATNTVRGILDREQDLARYRQGGKMSKSADDVHHSKF